MCGLSLLAIFTFWVFTLWHTTLVLYSKRKSSITASAPLTTKLISKQVRLNATKSVLVTLIAEADRALCQLVMFLTAFFYWVYKKWNSAAIKSLLLFVASLFNGFLVEKYVACQSRKSYFRWHRFRFHLAWCVRGLQSLKRYWLFLIPFRSCISNGKPEKLLYLMFVFCI